jgi:hypothetical protein
MATGRERSPALTDVKAMTPGQRIDLYEHEVRLIVGADEFRIVGYFSPHTKAKQRLSCYKVLIAKLWI